MTTALEGHRPLLVWQLQLQVGEDVDDIIVILCLNFRSPSAAEMYLLLSCFLLGGTTAEEKNTCKTVKSKLHQLPYRNENLTLRDNYWPLNAITVRYAKTNVTGYRT
jgi:hypothetical protein